MEAGCDRLGVLAQGTRSFFKYLRNPLVSAHGGFKYNWRKRRNFHFVGDLGPADQFVQIVERERPQNFGRKLNFTAIQVVFAQNQTESLHRKEVGPAGISKDVPPPTGFFDAITTASGYGRAAAGIDYDAFTVAERCRHSGIAITAGDDFRTRPNFGSDLR